MVEETLVKALFSRTDSYFGKSTRKLVEAISISVEVRGPPQVNTDSLTVMRSDGWTFRQSYRLMVLKSESQTVFKSEFQTVWKSEKLKGCRSFSLTVLQL